MPMTRLQTSAAVDDTRRAALLKALSRGVAGVLGKPEGYMMVVLEAGTPMLLGGDDAPCALAEVRSVGAISPEQARSLSATVSDLLDEHLGVPAGRTYLNMEGVPGSMWGYSGSTFG